MVAIATVQQQREEETNSSVKTGAGTDTSKPAGTAEVGLDAEGAARELNKPVAGIALTKSDRNSFRESAAEGTSITDEMARHTVEETAARIALEAPSRLTDRAVFESSAIVAASTAKAESLAKNITVEQAHTVGRVDAPEVAGIADMIACEAVHHDALITDPGKKREITDKVRMAVWLASRGTGGKSEKSLEQRAEEVQASGEKGRNDKAFAT